MKRSYAVVDVFTDRAYLGNPVAVALESQGLSTETMQAFANWTNLSETTFVLAPTSSAADYRVRIFTPGAELPFAGHPTLGTCHAWQAAQTSSALSIVQECGAGLIKLRRSGVGLAFAAPVLLREGPVGEQLLERIARALGIDAKRSRTPSGSITARDGSACYWRAHRRYWPCGPVLSISM